MPKELKDTTQFKAPKPLKEDIQPSEIEVTSLEAATNERFQKNENRLEKMNNLLMLGFVILLVMVATLVVMVLFDMKNTYNRYNDKFEQLQNDRYNILKERVNKLEIEAFQSSPSN